MQVALCANFYLCTLFSNCLVGRQNTPVQVAVGGGSMVASHVGTLVNALVLVQEKHHQHKLQVMPTASARFLR